MNDWQKAAVSPGTCLEDAIRKIDESGVQVALVVDAHDVLQGVLTDGDIRRAILQGKSLKTPIEEVMNKTPRTALGETSREELLGLMRSHSFHHLPLVNDDGKMVGLAALDELVGVTARKNWVVIMAGGLGKRLLPLTEHCPKPMLDLGGRPILETILENFAEQGFRKFYLSVNYKAEMIQNHFGNGEKWGVEIEYLHENKRLGTAGALSQLPQQPNAPLIVMNGDLLTKFNFNAMLQFHEERGALATMAVREFEYQVPYGVVNVEGSSIQSIVEKPTHSYFVNAGIYTLSPEALKHIPRDEFYDMPTLYEQLIACKLSALAYPLREYWLDIGRIHDFERAQQEYGEQFSA